MLTNSSTAIQASLAHPVQKAFLKCIQRRLRRTGFLLNLALAQLWYRTPTFHDSFHSWWIQSSPVLVHLFQSNMSLYGSKMGYECCFMLNSKFWQPQKIWSSFEWWSGQILRIDCLDPQSLFPLWNVSQGPFRGIVPSSLWIIPPLPWCESRLLIRAGGPVLKPRSILGLHSNTTRALRSDSPLE